MPGVADLSAEANKGKPQMVIKVDRQAAARYGLNADDILAVVQAGIGGEAVSTLIDGTRRFDIAVRLPEEFRNSPSAIAAIPIRTAEGAIVPFSQRGEDRARRGLHLRAPRVAAALRGAADGRAGPRRRQLRARRPTRPSRAKVKLPTGYWVEWGGAFENQQRAMERLAVIVPLTIGLIFILLYTAFNSVRHATLIIANVPFAIIGGIVGLFITGQYLSVPSAIGFIAVFGVAMLNGIVLVSVPQRPAQARPVDPRRGAPGRGAAAAAGADDRLGGDPRPGADADLHRRRRRDAAPAGHGGDRRADHLDRC